MPSLPVPVLAASAVAARLATGAATAPPPRVARYVLAESRSVVSPAGERASAWRGPVTVLGGTARWDLDTGTFPGSSASSLVVGERGGWLVDREGPVAARVGMEDFEALFVSTVEGDAGPFQSDVRDVEVAPAEAGKGPAIQGKATVRHRLTATWSLVTAMPGRVARIRSRLTAVVDLLDEAPAEVRSPLDDPDRLFDVPAPVREALAPELASLRGWPVGVVVEVESVQSVDYPGMAAPPSDGRAPLRSRTEARREVTQLVSRPAAEGDAALLALSEETRVVGIERLVEPRETLR